MFKFIKNIIESVWIEPNVNILSNMYPESIRQKFILKFGNDKYEEFVLSLYESFPRRDSLFFWQEQLLEKLSKELNIKPVGLEEAYSIFDYCPIHNVKLTKATVPIVNGNEYKPVAPYSEGQKYFPLANVDAPRDLDRWSYPPNVDVMYCTECRKVRELMIINSI